ncbi:MAG: DUF3619 family protein [Betaproteobacteria bacterium]|nr:DUF3619 family protein [Betaproteobacteria bacterium]
MNEEEFGQKITRTLNWGLSRIEEDKLAKLRAGRRKAMDAYREPVSILGLVTVSGQTLNVSNWIRKPLFWLPILAVSAALVTYSLNSGDDVYDDVGELDAKLLTGELPIDAFLDKDFASWVKESS